ncbi:MAG: hypothetical protein LBM06_06890 [Prevotellaceae bacterium]|jgi:hypothetical protein|nr:hypothetical protein [Prevotellaceae bacterium]
MNYRRILSLLLLILGEALLIIAFWVLKGTSSNETTMLNIVVLSIIYWLCFWDILTPLLGRDRSQRKIGSLGIRWAMVGFYALIAISFMVGGHIIIGAGVYPCSQEVKRATYRRCAGRATFCCSRQTNRTNLPR